MRNYRLALAATAAAALVVSAPVFASPVTGTDALKEWNLIVLGDLESTSEVEGRTFVGGDLKGQSSNYQIKTPPPSPNDLPGLTVVGDVIGNIKNLNNGSGATVGGNVDSGFNLNGGTQTVRVGGTISNTNANQHDIQSGLASSDPNFTKSLETQSMALAGSMKDLSGSLTDLGSNSVALFEGNRGTFNAVPDADGVAVFNIDASDLDRIGEIQFNLNGADTAIVNVSGKSITLNDNFLGGTANLGEHVIWNFNEAENLNLTTAWGGSVLAPYASATTGNYVQGSAVFGSLVQNGEFHLGTYNGNYSPPGSNPGTSTGGATPIPEGSMWLIFLLGAVGLTAGRSMRRKKAA